VCVCVCCVCVCVQWHRASVYIWYPPPHMTCMYPPPHCAVAQGSSVHVVSVNWSKDLILATLRRQVCLCVCVCVHSSYVQNVTSTTGTNFSTTSTTGTNFSTTSTTGTNFSTTSTTGTNFCTKIFSMLSTLRRQECVCLCEFVCDMNSQTHAL
jgi:hypothetical protein